MLEKVAYKDIWRFTLHYWRRRPGTVCALLALMIAATVVDAFQPLFTGKIVDAVARYEPGDPQGMAEIVGYIGIFAALPLTFHTLRWMAISLWAWFAVRNLYDIRVIAQ